MKTKIIKKELRYHLVFQDETEIYSSTILKNVEDYQRIFRRFDELILRFKNLLFLARKLPSKNTSFEVKEQVLRSQIFMDEIEGKIPENFTLKTPKNLISPNFLKNKQT